MKKLILLELALLFLATTFQSDNPPGWYEQKLPVNKLINDVFFLDSLNGWVITNATQLTDTGFVIKTTNGGIDWNISYSKSSLFTALQFVDYDTGYICGAAPGASVWKSTNGGSNWIQLVNFGLGFGLEDIQFVNSQTGWVSSSHFDFGGVWKTTDGGGNWNQQLTASSRIKRMFFLNSDTGWAVNAELNGKLFRTTNGGMNWNVQYSFPSGLGDVYFFNSTRGIVSSGRFYNSTDGGFTWNASVSTISGGKIDFTSDSIGWAGNNLLSIPKTLDGGLTWGLQTTNISNPSVSATDSLLAWAGGNKIVHTTDGGGQIVKIQQLSNEIPEEFTLFQNYPNPFNPVTKINYEIQITGLVKLEVYDITGRFVIRLVNAKQSPGVYEYTFNGSELSSGVYIYRMEIISENGKRFSVSKKMILNK